VTRGTWRWLFLTPSAARIYADHEAQMAALARHAWAHGRVLFRFVVSTIAVVDTHPRGMIRPDGAA
jgi:hypothetical protein